MATKFIDCESGELWFPGDFVVSSQTTSEEIIQHFGTENVNIRDIENGWKHYTVWNIKVNDVFILITFFFENDVLKSLHFLVSDEFFVMKSWDDWTEEMELKQRDYFDEWLTKEIGPNRQFAWGKIGAYFDGKASFSSIGLRYE